MFPVVKVEGAGKVAGESEEEGRDDELIKGLIYYSRASRLNTKTVADEGRTSVREPHDRCVENGHWMDGGWGRGMAQL